MKLKLDENLGRRVASLCRMAGHDVATVPEQGLTSATDHTLIDACRTEDRCRSTLDLDFANPLLFHPSDYSGIAVLRWPAPSQEEGLLSVVRTLLSAFERGEVQGRLWIVQVGRVREYSPEEAP